MSPTDANSRTVARLYRYPVKGMSAERLGEATLAPGQPLAYDRRFALAHGASGVDLDRPEWAPKTHFLTLARHPRLAELSVAMDSAAGTLALSGGDGLLAQAAIDDPTGRAALAAAVAAHMGEEAKGAVHLVEAAGVPFSDVPAPWLSLINMASLRALETEAGAPLDPLRFRANLYYEGGAAWEERDWPGREIAVGGARLRVEEPIERCAATNVNPASAARDLNLPLVLERRFGHVELGVYASVIGGGAVRERDPLSPA